MSITFLLFKDPAPTALYTLSLHDALPISPRVCRANRCDIASANARAQAHRQGRAGFRDETKIGPRISRSEEHTSELQSRPHLVCRLLLEKKKTKRKLHA